MSDELMTIGTFSLLAGLSVPTLRHYDEIGLLKPEEIDPRTQYRRYGPAQIVVARRVRLLRQAELSTKQIASVLTGGAALSDVIAAHRAKIDDEAARVRTVLDQVLQQDQGHQPMTMRSAAGFRLVAINLGVDSPTSLETAQRFWGHVLGTDLQDWGLGSQQVVLGSGDNIAFLNIRVRSSNEPHSGHTTAFGIGVPGLDETHRRSLDAGATEHYPPTDGENMPRHSLIEDPVGNRVVLWEGNS